jgi:hypothetical protein
MYTLTSCQTIGLLHVLNDSETVPLHIEFRYYNSGIMP